MISLSSKASSCLKRSASLQYFSKTSCSPSGFDGSSSDSNSKASRHNLLLTSLICSGNESNTLISMIIDPACLSDCNRSGEISSRYWMPLQTWRLVHEAILSLGHLAVHPGRTSTYLLFDHTEVEA